MSTFSFMADEDASTRKRHTRARVAEITAAGQDFEWYPTGEGIIRKVAFDLAGMSPHDLDSILDIGAGDGRVLVGIQEILSAEHSRFRHSVDLLAIEKCETHLANMPKEVAVIGTEFREQTLVDKPASVVFCNPPYSEYKEWALRILRECQTERVYLVIPRRWRECEALAALIDRLGIRSSSMGEFDFESADRRARCRVELVRFDIERTENDAFDRAICDMLPDLERFESEVASDEASRESQEALRGQLAKGGNLIDSLVEAYNDDLTDLYETYGAVVKIKPTLLKELGVEKPAILSGIRHKTKGLKDKYWQLLFDHLKAITSRLATKQRKQFLASINGKTSIDFTAGNARAMLVWICKWASEYADEQTDEMFGTLAQFCNVKKYVSNQRAFKENRWRYMDAEDTHYKVDYRLVLEGSRGINQSPYSFEARNGLSNSGHEFLGDFITIANCLGFRCSDSSDNYEWKSGKKVNLKLDDGETLVEVKAFLNGNLHLRANKRVMLAINVLAGKRRGWLRDADEAIRELGADKSDADCVRRAFRSGLLFEPSELLQLTDASN